MVVMWLECLLSFDPEVQNASLAYQGQFVDLHNKLIEFTTSQDHVVMLNDPEDDLGPFLSAGFVKVKVQDMNNQEATIELPPGYCRYAWKHRIRPSALKQTIRPNENKRTKCLLRKL